MLESIVIIIKTSNAERKGVTWAKQLGPGIISVIGTNSSMENFYEFFPNRPFLEIFNYRTLF